MAIAIDDQLIVQVEEKIDHRMDGRIQGFWIPMLVISEGSGLDNFDSMVGVWHSYRRVLAHLSEVGGLKDTSMGNSWCISLVDINNALEAVLRNPFFLSLIHI